VQAIPTRIAPIQRRRSAVARELELDFVPGCIANLLYDAAG
jgi:hypothetical protein